MIYKSEPQLAAIVKQPALAKLIGEIQSEVFTKYPQLESAMIVYDAPYVDIFLHDGENVKPSFFEFYSPGKDKLKELILDLVLKVDTFSFVISIPANGIPAMTYKVFLDHAINSDSPLSLDEKWTKVNQVLDASTRIVEIKP